MTNNNQNDLQFINQYIRHYHILTPVEETKLFKDFMEFHDGEICTHILATKPFNLNCLETHGEQKKLKKIQDQLVNHNIRLVISIARKNFLDLGLPLEDLVNEGIGGLVHAIHRFKPELKNKLSTYATMWIKQYIGRALENKSRLVRVPNNKLQLISKLKRIVRRHLEKYGEKPIAEEIALAFSKLTNPIFLTTEEVEELGRLQFGWISLDYGGVGENDENLSMINYIPGSESSQPEVSAELIFNKTYLSELLVVLNPEERKYIILKFGLVDQAERSVRELVGIFNKSAKDLQLMEVEILAKLRKAGTEEKVNF